MKMTERKQLCCRYCTVFCLPLWRWDNPCRFKMRYRWIVYIQHMVTFYFLFFVMTVQKDQVRYTKKGSYVKKKYCSLQSEYRKKWKTSITPKRVTGWWRQQQKQGGSKKQIHTVRSSHSFIEVRIWKFGEKQR